ncbi:hypothetical protein [Ideonella oryzae]|uniref:DUF4148 domain-containing protein n=1 Tax=Ideonella oryzae TaxID=2937441 RepID=A0ABT1BP53_9BURK|nr:hypothetical protein [Ideonella oryzae]MCO5977986.1 hypothetical protein [Ideonella oryzae]
MNIIVNIKRWLNTQGVAAAAILLSGGPTFAMASVDPYQLARNMILSTSTQATEAYEGTTEISSPIQTDPHALARKVMHSDEDVSVTRQPSQEYHESDMKSVSDLQRRIGAMISDHVD